MARGDEPGIPRGGKRNVSGSGKWSEYRPSSGTGDGFNWAGVDASILLDTIVAVAACGDAILFGTTRDGGCGVATVCSGPDGRYKFYFRDVEQAERELELIRKYARGE